MGDVSPTPHQLLVEAVIFWSIGVVIFFGRMYVEMTQSTSKVALTWYQINQKMIYTTLLVLIQISSRYATNLMDPKDYDEVLADPKQVRDRIFGSKIVIGLEQCMLFSTWGVKTCMLILYWRITQNLRSNLYIKILSVYVALGFVVIMVCYYAVYCRPFSQYWAMPVKNMQCATYQRYSITQAVFNISSDAVMFAIPIPLLIKAQVKKARKVVLIGVMSLGLFTIIAAILNKYFNFASPLTTTYQIWYIREASTAIYVANLMCWWPLLRKIFGLTAFSYNSNRGRRANDQNKDSEYSGSSSQSRPSFSRTLERLKPPCRKNAKNVPTARNSRHGIAHRSSQEAITRGSGEHDGASQTEEYIMDVWSKNNSQGDDIEDSSSASMRLHPPLQQSPLKEPQDQIKRTV
ncbi:hypothetical protein N7523_010885 [Penicillium sp. IBT 18751x]|nr:hypothetical protein N7523_010885 [Penicillium sp. IBT 18751x]